MGIKKKEIVREYHKFVETWMPKCVERGTLLLLSIKDKTEIKEDDLEVLKFFYCSYYNGELSQFLPEASPPKEQNVTQSIQTELFNNFTEGLKLPQTDKS
jgi:hypothetical protein